MQSPIPWLLALACQSARDRNEGFWEAMWPKYHACTKVWAPEMELSILASGALSVASSWPLNIICVLFPGIHMVSRLAVPSSAQERVWKDSRLHFNMVGMGVGMEISRSL